MGRYRGYIIAEGGGRRVAMRSPHTKSTKQGAINDIKRENKEWESVNKSKWNFKRTFGAYEIPRGQEHRFPPGHKGNGKLLKYHDREHGLSASTAKKHGVNFGRVGYNRFTSTY